MRFDEEQHSKIKNALQGRQCWTKKVRIHVLLHVHCMCDGYVCIFISLSILIFVSICNGVQVVDPESKDTGKAEIKVDKGREGGIDKSNEFN